MKLVRFSAALVLGAGVLLAACGDDGDGNVSTGSDVDPPNGADEVVLQLSTGGGFVPVQDHLRQTPEYSLYGDGTVITIGPQIEIFPPPALTPLMAGHLDEAQIHDVLRRASDAGLLTEGVDYGDPRVTDLPTTTITVDAGDGPVVTDVYALSFGDDPGLSDEQERNRGRLAEFIASLTDGDPEAYEPHGYAVFPLPYEDAAPDPELEQPPVDWPFADLADAPAPDGDQACVTVAGDDAVELRELAAGTNTLTPWVSGGAQYQLVFRSLLPNESGCESVLGLDAVDDGIEHPSGSDEVVLRIATGPGGFGPFEAYQGAGVPEVAVYGDGRVVFVGDPDAPDETSLPDVQTVVLSDDGLQAVLALLDGEGLLVEEPDFGDPGITDQAFTDLTVSAGGVAYSTSVYALGLSADQRLSDLTPEQQELRDGLVRVRDLLLDPAFLEGHATGAPEPFSSDGLVVHATPDDSDEELDSATWPVDGTLASECTVLTGDDAAAVRALATTTPLGTRWLDEGTPYRVRLRPLYPEESSCDDLVAPAVGVGA